MSAEYTEQQVIYALNSIANAPSGKHGTVEELGAYAEIVLHRTFNNSAIIDLIGEWEVVWGPKVYQVENSTVADNAMYVARNKTSPTQYVVAISGTNPISAYGWIVEDFMINPPVTTICNPPRLINRLRMSHSAFGSSSSPITNNIMTTPNSAKCCKSAVSDPTKPNRGPMAMPANR